MSTDRLSRSLYRTLLRLGRQFDRSPAAKVILFRKNVSNDISSTPALYYSQIVGRIFGDQNGYFLDPIRAKSFSMKEIVRSEFRSTNNTYSVNDKVDVAFAFVRKFTAIWKSFTDLVNSDQTINSTNPNPIGNLDPKASGFDENGELKIEENDQERDLETELYKKVENVPVAIAETLAPGVLLIAHPMVHGDLQRSVILILEHNSNGSYGVVINNISEISLAMGVKNLPIEYVQHFGNNIVYKGGLIRRLQCIHNLPECGGSQIPFCKQPTFAGSTSDKLTAHMKAHPEDSTKVRFFAGCSVWDAGMLENEWKRGYWVPIISKPDELIDACLVLNGPSVSSSLSTTMSTDDSTNAKESAVSVEPENDEVLGRRRKLGRLVRSGSIGGATSTTASTAATKPLEFAVYDEMDVLSEVSSQYEVVQLDTWDWLMVKLGFGDFCRLPHWKHSTTIDSVDLKP